MNQSLKLGVLDLVPRLGESTFEDALQQAAELARCAEAWGYHRYWAAEHHDLEHLSCASPEILLSHIGARTERIRLGSGAVLLPHYSPLKVAENFRMLAALYPGRIDLGVGRAPGGSAHTSMALSGNFLGHVADLPNRIRALTELMEDRYRYEDVPVAAKPVPAIAPALWMLGTNTKSAGYAAEFGTGYVFGQFMSDTDGAEVLRSYREAFRPSAQLEKPQTIVAVSVICAETEELAREMAADAARLGQQRSGQPEQESVTRPGQNGNDEFGMPGTTVTGNATAHSSDSGAADADGPEANTAVDGRVGPIPQRAMEDISGAVGSFPRILTGTAESVKSVLKEMAEKYACEEFLIVTPVADYAARLKSYRLLMGM
ncbi:MsnO8 family LLM class oxidoreductase [Paenibacillus lactis]|uniref:Luciferase family oxidoreductase group 1 n=1 Tax=Paenibacillus lactis TaxID=228574 RepID=A0ABS4F8C3_9BACL|nr:MsnO8 family LLM class oxidoreductase [Paenibacillus lactis]MBP1892498.1 luciferase family oxidoreductase group 1 [Paenibacillus lactis]HAF97061.1 LLM class flavin-dependent oxidoreductase [Paenibacillus lactis]